MSDRYTRKDAQSALERLAKVLSLPVSTGHGIPGLRLDPGVMNGKYRIVYLHGMQSYHETRFTWEDCSYSAFGDRLFSARELCEHVYFVMNALVYLPDLIKSHAERSTHEATDSTMPILQAPA